MKILEIIFKMLMLINIGILVGMLHFILLSMVIENSSETHIIIFGITYPLTVFITYVYVFAVKHCIIDEIEEN